MKRENLLVAIAVTMALGLILVWAVLVFAANLTFVWTANTEPDLAGYRLYSGTGPGVYPTTYPDIPKTATEVTVDVGSHTHFALTAFDKSGNESDKSEIDIVPPARPAGFRRR